MKSNRRTMLLAATLAVPMTAFALTAPSAAQDMTPAADGPCAGMEIFVAQANPGFPRLPIYVAKFGGFFAKTGLDVRIAVTNSGADATAALVGRSADVNAGTFGDVLLARSRGAPIVAFAASGYEEISNLVIKKAVMDENGLDASSPADEKIRALKGLRVGVTSPGSSTDLLVRSILAQQGLTDKDVQIIAVGASAIAPTFVRGQIDAFALSSPSANAASAIGDGEVAIKFATGEYPGASDTLSMTMNTSERALEDKKQELVCFRDAIAGALALMKSDPEKATELAWNEFDGVVDRAAFDATIGENISAFADDTHITAEAARKRRDFLTLAVPSLKDVDVESAFSNLD